MSRKLLILALWVSGTGCSATRPLWSTIVVTPPRVSFRQLPREDSSHWTPVAITYPSESLTPASCTPSPDRPTELMTFFEEDERPVPPSPSEPVPSLTTVALVSPVPAPAPLTIAHLEDATSPQPAHLLVSSVAPAPLASTPIVQAAVVVTYPSESLIPASCTPSSIRPAEQVTFFEEGECPAPPSPSEPVESVATVAPVPPVHVPAPSVRVESPTPTASHWKPATNIGLVSPVQISPAIRGDQDETTLSEVRPVLPVESLSPPVLVPPDLSELLTEIRNQRQLIEALQRDLTRERSADDAAIDELEAAVENLLVQTKTAPLELPSTLRK